MTLDRVPSIATDWQHNNVSESLLLDRMKELDQFTKFHRDYKTIDELLRLLYIEVWRGRPSTEKTKHNPQSNLSEAPPPVVKFWKKALGNGPSHNFNLIIQPSPWYKYKDQIKINEK